MRQQARLKAPPFPKLDNFVNRSFDVTRTENISTSQDLKSTIEYNDIGEPFSKGSTQNGLLHFLRSPVFKTEDIKTMSQFSKPIKAYKPESFQNVDTSLRCESDLRVESLKEDTNQSFSKSGKIGEGQKSKKTSNTSFSKEEKKTVKKSGKQRSVSPVIKDTDLSQNKGLNYTKIANQASLRFSEQLKSRKANSSLRGSQRLDSTNTSKLVNQSFNLENTRVSNTSPSRKPPISKTTKTQADDERRNTMKIKQTRESEVNKSRSSVPRENHNTKFNDHFKNHEKNFLTYMDTKDTTKDSKVIDTVPDLTELSEKEIKEMNSSIAAYYDLLIERDHGNSRLLHNLKDNFNMIMKEFVKNNKTVKQYDSMKQKHREEKEKAKKEREVLEFQLNALKKENDRLKELNIKHIKKDENKTEASPPKQKETKFINKTVQEKMLEEKGLLDLLQQREKLLLFMKAKEERYVSMLQAVEERGINVEDIYQEKLKKRNKSCETNETKTESFLDKTLNKSFDGTQKIKKGKKGKSKPQKVKDPKQTSQELNQSLLRDKNRLNNPKMHLNQILESDHDNLPKHGPHYWERQFTEASNSKTFSQYSDSMFSYQPGQTEHTIQYFAHSPFEYIGSHSKKVNPNKKKPKNSEESPVKPKGNFKLDLSSIHQKIIKQYHDEFMEKYSEFTSSWKRAMQKDKTYQHSNT